MRDRYVIEIRAAVVDGSGAEYACGRFVVEGDGITTVGDRPRVGGFERAAHEEKSKAERS
jgi:hypothetical protein